MQMRRSLLKPWPFLFNSESATTSHTLIRLWPIFRVRVSTHNSLIAAVSDASSPGHEIQVETGSPLLLFKVNDGLPSTMKTDDYSEPTSQLAVLHPKVETNDFPSLQPGQPDMQMCGHSHCDEIRCNRHHFF